MRELHRVSKVPESGLTHRGSFRGFRKLQETRKTTAPARSSESSALVWERQAIGGGAAPALGRGHGRATRCVCDDWTMAHSAGERRSGTPGHARQERHGGR